MEPIDAPSATAVLKGKSMFGTQELSSRRSAPAHGFGSSTRGHAAKLFIGSEHAKTSIVANTPGPDYDLVGACGNQSDSGKVSPPQWCFGTADRFASGPRKRSPGPGQYNSNGAFGKQSLSHNSSFPLYGFGSVDRTMASKVFISPAHAASSYGQASPGPAAMYAKPGGLGGHKYGFGTDGRFNRLGRQLSESGELPGPGSYSTNSTFNSQASSKLETSSSYGFGSSNREHQKKVFVSEMQAKAAGTGPSSPGPSVYTLNSSIGAQATSRGRSAPSWGFGKAGRFSDKTYETGTPGPGSYST